MSRLYIAYRPITPSPPDPTASMEPETIAFMNFISIPYDTTIYFSSTAFEITGIEYWNAINDFVVSIKTSHSLTLGVNNLSTVYDVIYPMIGGSSTTCKINLCNPLDTDAAFRLSFSGGWTYSGGGALSNGTNGYANTHWDSTSNAGVRRVAYGGYSRTLLTSGTKIHGSWDLNNPTRLLDFAYSPNFILGNTSALDTNPNTSFHAVRMDATTLETVVDGVSYYTTFAANYDLCSIPFYLGARNNNNASINVYTDEELAFYFITGKVEITSGQLIALSNAVEQLQVDLNRNI